MRRTLAYQQTRGLSVTPLRKPQQDINHTKFLYIKNLCLGCYVTIKICHIGHFLAFSTFGQTKEYALDLTLINQIT